MQEEEKKEEVKKLDEVRPQESNIFLSNIQRANDNAEEAQPSSDLYFPKSILRVKESDAK